MMLPKPTKREKATPKPLRRSRIKYLRAHPAKRARERCAREWSLAVLERDCYRCQVKDASCLGRVDPHHVFHKGAFTRVRFCRWNGIALCRRHHDIAHDDTRWFELIMRARWGDDLYEYRLRVARGLESMVADR
jgi:hypothetical protein